MSLKYERPIIIYKGNDNKYHFNGGFIPTINNLLMVKKLINKSLLLGQEEINKENEKTNNYWAKKAINDKNLKVNIGSKKNNGYIYIYKQDNNYKIGKSKKIDCRIRKYITENPYEIELFLKAYVSDYSRAEIELHNIFKEYKINSNREWFIFDKKSLTDIVNLEHSNWGKEFIIDLIINRFK